MNRQIFTKIILVTVLIAYVVQFITAIGLVKDLLSGYVWAIVVGLCIYTGEVMIFRFLLKSDADLVWEPFKGKEAVRGMIAFVLVLLVTNFCVNIFDQHAHFGGYDDLSRYLLIFFLNLLPSAMTEEWVFRFLPVRLVRLKLIKLPIPFYLLVTLIFMLIHVPKYFFSPELGTLTHVFISGLIFLTIYLLTQNLLFGALVHAFTNRAWFVYESTSNWLFLYLAITAVTLCWALLHLLRRRAAVPV